MSNPLYLRTSTLKYYYYDFELCHSPISVELQRDTQFIISYGTFFGYIFSQFFYIFSHEIL